MHAAAVLWRTPAGAGEAPRVCQRGVRRFFAFVGEPMLPVITEVVDVERGKRMVSAVIEVIRHAHTPTGNAGPLSWFLIGRNANARDFVFGVKEPELMEMIVEPPHRILDGDVEVPEGVRQWHLDSAPDKRIGPAQDDEKLMNEFGLLAGRFSWR